MSDEETTDNVLCWHNGDNNWNYDATKLNVKGVPHLISLLKDTKIECLFVMRIDIKGIKHLSEVLKSNTAIKELRIEESYVGDQGARYLAEALKYTEIDTLCLEYANIGDEGAKCLAQQFKESKVIDISLGSNDIGDAGLEYLADAWNEGKIVKLRLNDNNITTNSSQIIAGMFGLDSWRDLLVMVRDSEDDRKFINVMQTKSGYPTIEIDQRRFSRTLAEFVSKTFNEIGLNLAYLKNILKEDIDLFKQAIKGTTIKELFVRILFKDYNLLEHLTEMVGNHHIYKFSLSGLPNEVCNFPSFLKKQVSHLEIKYLRNLDKFCDIIQFSNIRYLSILGSSIVDSSFASLASVLKHTKIVKLELDHFVNSPNFRILVDGLKNTQITHLKLSTVLTKDDADYFAGIINDTQLVSIDFNEEGIVYKPNMMANLSKNKGTADQICSAFDSLVTLDHSNDMLELRLSDCDSLDRYVTFVQTLWNNPNVRAHIIYDRLEIAEKVDLFVINIQDRFNTFINNNIQYFAEKYEQFNFINLIKEFDMANLRDIVRNLLLHRILFYVDEFYEILHPIVYTTLFKYELPLYNEQMEPNKKYDIIKYYKEHPTIDGAEDLLKLL